MSTQLEKEGVQQCWEFERHLGHNLGNIEVPSSQEKKKKIAEIQRFAAKLRTKTNRK